MQTLLTGNADHCSRPFSHDDIARWLLTADTISKNKLGDYLGGADRDAISTLNAFVDALNFEHLSVTEALRFFLSLFRLPGESQQIARIMETFASAYTAHHPNMFRNPDAMYILAYSMIMLNTDAHSDQIMNKMTRQQFISNNRGIDDGNDLPVELLTEIYDSIVSDEIRIEQREYISSKKEGWLHKRGGRIKTWKLRYMILSGNVLYYFKSPKDREPLGMVPLEGIQVKIVPGGAKDFLFEVTPLDGDSMKSVRTGSGGFEQGHHKVFRFGASSAVERSMWVEAIRLHSVEDVRVIASSALESTLSVKAFRNS